MPLYHRGRLRFTRRVENVASTRRCSSMWDHRVLLHGDGALPRSPTRRTVVLVLDLVKRRSRHSDHGRGDAALGGRGGHRSLRSCDGGSVMALEGVREVITGQDHSQGFHAFGRLVMINAISLVSGLYISSLSPTVVLASPLSCSII